MADDHQHGDRQKVLIAGAGIAGLEAALALREIAGEGVEVALHDSRQEFVFKPFAIGEPYGTTRSFRYDLRRLSERCGATLRSSTIAAVEPERRLAVTRDGERLAYDHLIVATGARMLWAVPGAVTYRGVVEEGEVGDLIAALRAGRLQRVAFTMPAGHNWALPLYELALLAATATEKAGSDRAQITIVTPEPAPLAVFGRRIAEQVSALLAEQRIEVIAATQAVEFKAGRLRTAAGGDVEAEAAVTLPRMEGRCIGGIPHDADGFVDVDEYGRVAGLARVHAAGDVSSHRFKQGAFATQQADTVAEAIAAAAGAGIEPRPFDAIKRAVLWTGRGPRYLCGREGDGDDGSSGPSERHLELLHNGRLTARFLTPLVDSLIAESDSLAGAAATVGAPQRR
ncbi:MAG TPA: FAD-dependent oxidoreductase [Solirubrobacterales bacterium]|nr:FAD-dependent oxidoreductase [Solirubrobacterales bacterium]